MTGSAEDSTLFFFDISSNYMPIGFMKLEAPVKTMAWSNSSVSFRLCQSVLFFVIQSNCDFYAKL